MIVEVISRESLVQLRRHARLEKRKECARALSTTLRDVIDMWHADLSAFRASLARDGARHESEAERFVAPELPSDEVVGPYEDKAGVRLLLFARDAGTPVLVNFGYKPSKRFEENLRHSAKIRGCSLHFYRLIDVCIAIDVESDARFLRRLGINAV